MKNTHSGKSVGNSILLASILGAGALASWIFLCSIIGSIGSQWTKPPLQEYARVNRAGEAIVQQYHEPDQYMSFRTTDGQPIIDRNRTQNAALCGLSVGHISRYQLPMNWQERIKSFGDGQNPPTCWYLITSGLPQADAYFVGYDSVSKQRIGYLGTQGFRGDLPPDAERFSFPSYQLQSSVVAYYYSPLGKKPNNYVTSDEKVYIAHVISAGKLFRINIDRRSVEPVELPEDVISVAVMSIPKSVSPDNEDYDYRLVVRTSDKIYLLSFKGSVERTISIPQTLQHAEIELYLPQSSQVIYSVRHFYPANSTDIYWCADDGQVTRQIQVPLAGWEPPNPTTIAWLKAVQVPSPVCYAVVLLLVLPITALFENLFPNYSAALDAWWSAGWPALLAVCILSAILAVYCYRRHKRFSETGAAAWALFVFLFGVSGLLGYLLHRRWPVTEKCQHCGDITPRDRDACLDCGAEFPLPPLKGIEIFA